ncbi:TPA: hypothetical protein ACH3X1_016357 [Trebouxia sp. C0004]
MQAAKVCHQVLTSFRSVSGLTGIELAGTSGPKQLFRGAMDGAQRFPHVINKLTAQISTSGDGAHLSASIHKCSKHPLHSISWSPKVLLGQQSVPHSRPFVASSRNGLACAQKQHRTLISQASSRSMWQRHCYSSGYGRGYGRGDGSYWDGDKVLYSLIAVNCAGFFLWQSDPNLMERHAMVSINSIREGRMYTLLTSAFSHASLNHLFANMFTFYFFGREIGLLFGGKKLLALYVAGGIVGSLAHVAFFYFKAQSTGADPWIKEVRMANSPGALGASAALNAIVLLDILLYPRRMVYLYMVLPVPAALFGVVYIVGSMTGLLGGIGGNMAHAGHLGGAAVGAAYFLALRLGRIR